MTSAAGNWSFANGATSARTAMIRFSSLNSFANKQMHPVERMKSPMASGLRMKTRKRDQTV
jgi:hypothetical protein